MTSIAPDKDGWIVNVIDRTKPVPKNPDTDTDQIQAGMVILAAGSLGSTRILARSRKDHGLALSKKLGEDFSANGDVLGFGLAANLPGSHGSADPPTPLYSIGAGKNAPDGPPYQPGPCITGVIRVDMTDDKPLEDGMVIEDGTAPGALAAAYPPMMFLQGVLTADYSEFPDMQNRMEAQKTLGEALQSGVDPTTLSYDGVMTQMQSYLLMSHDSATGQLVYNDDSKQIYVNWPGAGSEASFLRDNDKLHEAAGAIWANYIANPIWETGFGRNIVSVHPLGGCPMSDKDTDGVTNADCHVYTGDGNNTVYDTLLVCDGSVIPRSLGVNPLLTISAITERAMDVLIGDVKAKDTADLGPIPDQPPAEDQAAQRAAYDWQEIVMGIGAACVVTDSIVQACKNKSTFLAPGEIGALLAGIIPNYTTTGLAAFVTEFYLKCDWDDLGTAAGKIADKLRLLFAAACDVENGGSMRTFLNTFIHVVGDVSPGFGFDETMHGYVSERRVSQDDTISDPYEIAEGIGTADGRKLVANFTVSAASTLGRTAQGDVIANVANATLSKTVSLTGADGTLTDYTVSGGTFDLLPADANSVETWLMTYRCELMAPDATAPTWEMTGTKYLRQRSGSFWWQDLTTLYVDLTPLDPDGPDTALQGIIRLDLQDLVAQMTTISGGFGRAMEVGDLEQAAYDAAYNRTLSAEIDKKTDGLLEKALLTLLSVSAGSTADTWQVKLANKLEEYFGAGIAAIFADRVFRTYGGYAAYMTDFASQSDVHFEPLPQPGIDSIQGSKCTHVPLPDAKGPLIHLFHFPPPDPNQPAKGPILLAPGMSTTSLSFALNTIDTSLVDRLLSENYDVWLFDSRLSPPVMPQENGDKAQVKTGYTLDDIAAEDWPMAVDHVLAKTVVKGAESIQVLGHCVGALTAQMALLGGHVETAKIRQLLLMQFTVHPAASWFNVMKSELGLADDFVNGFPPFVAKLVHAELGDGPAWDSVQDILTNGIPSINPVSPNPKLPDYQTPLDVLHNTVDWNAPFGIDHVCLSPTCHRIYGLYGPVIAHKNLNEKTHIAMRHIFGEVATKPFEQLGLIMQRGRAVSSEGEDIYLPNFEWLRLPIHIISGTINQIVLPESGFSTLHWLRTKMPRDAHLFTRTIIEGYAHNDCLIGKDANKDVFDGIMRVLDAHGSA